MFIHGKLKNIAIGSVIVPTQPFGFNFLGGKLIASLTTSKYVREIWKKKYGDILAGITTTSLYGSASMYNSIPYWKKLGMSKGKISIKPDDYIYRIWTDLLKMERFEEIEKAQSGTSPKQKTLKLIFEEMGINTKDYEHGFQRGVYFSQIYENSREFLRSEINEQELILRERFEKDIEGMMDWWRPKAIKRYKNLLAENRIKPEISYYHKMAEMSWSEARNDYLGEVGR